MGGHLWRCLRCQKQKRKRYAGGRDRRGQILGRRSITFRPESIERRVHIGQWEGDSVIGAGQLEVIYPRGKHEFRRFLLAQLVAIYLAKWLIIK
jgi:IS30 family transposase